MNFEEKFEFAKEKFKSFSNYLEISDFREFLLLILNIEESSAKLLHFRVDWASLISRTDR